MKYISGFRTLGGLSLLALAGGFHLPALANPPGGALDPNTTERYRVIVSTDIGGDDFDDDQSMVHLLHYADELDIEGLISSPPGNGRDDDILQVISAYEQDYNRLSSYSAGYPIPDYLRSVTKQGQTAASPPSGSSAGSDWIIARAQANKPGYLYVLVWGSLTDVAQAVYEAPSIKNKIRVVCTGGSAGFNHNGDPGAWNYLHDQHLDLWMVNQDSTFRGMYVASWNNTQYGNGPFVGTHCANHGALGEHINDLVYPNNVKHIKAGDTPLVLYLLRGDPNNPALDHWGGRFYRPSSGTRPNYWTDITDLNWSLTENGNVRYGAKTVSQYHDSFMADWAGRLNRSQSAKAGAPTVSIASATVSGSNVTIQANASDSGSVTKVEFYAGGTLLGADTSSPFNFSWNGAPVGTHTLRAKAIDNSNSATLSAATTVTVTSSGGTESVALSAPPMTVTAGNSYAVNVNYTANQSRVVQVVLYTSSWGAVGSSYVTVGSGSGTANLSVPVSAGATAGGGYQWVAKLWPTNWSAAIDDDIVTGVIVQSGSGGTESVTLNNPPMTVTAGGSYTVNVNYAANQNRVIQLVLYTSSWGSVGSHHVTVGAGSGTAALPITVSAGAAPGSGYQWMVKLWPTSWSAAIDDELVTGVTVSASAATVTITSVSSGDAYVTAAAGVGVKQWIDRDYLTPPPAIASMSAGLGGSTIVRTANDDKELTTPSHLTLQISATATVYVVYDTRISPRATWLDGTWASSSQTVTTSDGTPWTVYQKQYSAGQVVLGGNQMGSSPTTSACSHYFVLVK